MNTLNPRQRRPVNYALGLFAIVLALMCVSLVMVYASSAAKHGLKNREPRLVVSESGRIEPARTHSADYLRKQFMWVSLSLVPLLFLAHFDYARYKKIALWMLVASVVLLLAVFVFPRVNGARRWIRIPPFTFQPSELAKLSLVLYMVVFLEERSEVMHKLIKCVLPAIGVTALVVGLIFAEPDFGGAAVLALIVFVVWFVGGIRRLYLFGLGAVALPTFAALLWAAPYRRERLLAFLHPEDNLMRGGWQAYQSLVALGSGGARGVGLGQSIQKYLFLSEPHTDFIFAIIGEETGLIGATILLLLYVSLVFIGLRVAHQSPDYYGAMIAFGMTAVIAVPVIVNLGVVTSCLPTKGLALPFMSYGGSSMIVNCAAVGILMNVAAQNYRARLERHELGLERI